jgi:transposase-like protein
VREAVLIKSLQRKEDLEHLRFIIMLKANLIDKTQKSSMDDLKTLFQQYIDTLVPELKKERKNFAKESQKLYKNFLTKWKNKQTTK